MAMNIFLCTANVQRSKTAEKAFSRVDKTNNYRSACLSYKYTHNMNSTMCSEDILQWADTINWFEDMHIKRIKQHTGGKQLDKITNLKIADEYQYFQWELVLILLDKLLLQPNI
ncbi:MAG: putative protein tyrosine phosphatase [Psychroserpens sp.]|jgi:predicted protein tyrosine phosphatase